LAVIGQHLGSLWIDGGVVGAEVVLEDRRVATLPLTTPIRVVAGTLSVEVRAPGFESVSRPIIVVGGGEAREVVHLTRVARSGSGTAAAGQGDRVGGRQSSGSATVGGLQRGLGWASLVVGVVGVGVGVGAVVSREGAVREHNDEALCPGRLSPSQPPDCRGLIERVETMDVLSTVGFVAGGALAITSVILLATSPSGRSNADLRTRVVGIVGPGVVGAQCVIHF